MKKKVLIEWGQSLLEAIIIVGLLYLFLWPLKINGNSMEPTFFSNDRVVISRAFKFFGEFKRNSLVVCKLFDNNIENVIIKRIIAIPGDTIKIIEGQVYINDKLLKEDYVYNNVDYNVEELTLHDNQYFLMGDNRILSFDSRNVGPIYKKDIIGLVLVKWFPFNMFEIY